MAEPICPKCGCEEYKDVGNYYQGDACITAAKCSDCQEHYEFEEEEEE